MIATAALVSAFVTGAHAATVNFENEIFAGDEDNVGTSYTNGMVTFTSLDGNDLYLAKSGANQTAFVPNDTVTPVGTFGDVFLTGDFVDNSSLSMSFASALSAVSFDIADIDGGGNQAEVFTFTFKNAGLTVGTVVRQAGVAPTTPGDGAVTTVSFSGLFDTVDIFNATVGQPQTGSNRNIGWGLDNIVATPVPLPAGGLLILTALGGLAVARSRKKA
jgi:hypothetical protein